jgi:plasmid stabilization system protein ParE
MMSEIRLDEEAKADLLEIWRYIAADNPDAADRMLDRIWDGFEGDCSFSACRNRST